MGYLFIRNPFSGFILVFSVVMLDSIYAELTPPYFNLATGRKIEATATCGVDTNGPELYCKLVGANTENDNHYFSVIQGQVCDTCDPSRPDKNHPPENAIDGKETWWQSPPLSRGMKYNEVNLTIDFGQEFHVAYLFIRMGNSPRPGLWTLEKSSDYGKTWTPWQHFSDTPADCETYFGRNSLKPITNDNDVICTTEYSKIVPLENGEIPVMLLNNRPSANNYFNSSVLQEWTRATNIRIRLLRTKNLLGHLMSVARQDPTVTRRYFYSIKDISIGGRCMCNGHADTCDVLDPKSARRILACRCQHRTCGIQCNECCPGYEQKKWRQNTKARPFQCEPCNCFGHSNHCIYDEDIDINRLSVDIHGNYDGGGICQDCQHNTEGINCNKCKSTYYRPYGKYWNETDVCRPCGCDYFYSTGNCEEETGRCECRHEFQPPNCDSCAYGYFGYPNCRECQCNLNGTEGYHCEARDGACPCKYNFAGHYCKECSDGYFSYPECKPCECDTTGSISTDCDLESGQCKCSRNFGGKHCERCKDGYYSHPSCQYCDCDIHGSEEEICNKDNGRCLCREGYGGPRCDQCLPGFYNYPDCVPCNCSSLGSISTTCDITGKCSCLLNFAGRQCTSCSAGYYSYPECLPCNCNLHGSEGISCNADGQCLCLHNFDGKNCELCKEGFYNFPACEECNCDPAGVIARFAGCGSVPAGELCQCKERVTGRICDQCKPLYWNLNISNPDGCEVCDCYLDGTVGSLDTCDSKTGQCTCKPSVQNRQCKECKDGTFDLFGGSLFGCKDCGCDIGGSRNSVCDKLSGECTCHPRVTGRTCTHPLTTHYFPTLYQFQFEYEDGYTPSGAHVRYQYDENLFPGFSRKGYAVFSNIQNEVINEVTVFKSSVYRMVIRYLNPTDTNVTAGILITSDNPNELDQTTKVLFRPTHTPQFVTVASAKGVIPSPIVLDPGRYTISIKTDKNIMLDYFVLLPAAYYEASILTRKIENPCEIGNLKLCRHYNYPFVTEFKPSIEPFITDGERASKANEFYTDFEHLSIIDQQDNIPLISDTQRTLKYLVDVPRTGRYVIIIDYITDRALPDTYYVKVRASDDQTDYGIAILYPCLYTTVCRQPVVDDDSREKQFYIDVSDFRAVELYHEHDDFGRIAIKSVTAIPVEQWSVDFIKPSPVCVMKEGKCVKSVFRTVPDSKKIEFEYDHEHRTSIYRPPNIYDNDTKLIYLDQQNSTLEIRSKVSTPGRYVILVKYYQPNHPEFNVLFRLDTGKQKYDGKFKIMHCPSNSGCREIVLSEGYSIWFDIDDEFTFTLTNNKPQGVWLDYLLIVPIDQYNDNLLQEDTFDQTKQFIRQCGQNHFHIQLNATEFCKKAVFSLTSDYNNGALPCNCDYEGSTSFECDPFGGQCQCKPNIIGRQCEACRTGFYGFPDCKHCDCPLTALCEKDTGDCICPPHVTGEKCDQCQPFTYGFHQIIGCEECNCDPLGVVRGNLQCDLNNGTCSCRENIEGRACDRCANGFYNFPNCEPCRCNVAGTTFEICNKQDESCFCRKNVVGRNCETCADGTYNLQSTNPEGCTKCFCFGKTTRCESAYLRVFNISMSKNTSINTVSFEDGLVDFNRWDLAPEDVMINETTLQAELLSAINDEDLVYFGMLDYILNQNNHLTAYGGSLVYTLYYTTGLFGNAILGPDIILHGKDNILIHQSYEQPANAQIFRGSVKMIETNFQTIDHKPVSRAEFMIVLRDLVSIYIRANYWQKTVVSQLSDVYLTMADEDDENYNLYQELPVEKCYCPPGYTGLSCEDCAQGYYRDPDGPFGGYCIPCQCNGHADTCDCNTGICQNCKHFTTGEHCDKCIEGYHGVATYGTPHDCMICACPLPYDSNNFATQCEISEAGNKIHCTCKSGYTGAKCESCAPGFYGQPELLGDYCKPCDCSGNINPNEAGSCDTVTGECLMCLNNTFGRACNLCAPGYYGDAVKLKDCKSCDCKELGTSHCDSFIGACNCHANVIGPSCDRCEPDHYGYDSGLGCKVCDCAVASNSSQCDEHTGNCPCKPGVTGRNCDRCAADHWNYTSDGCVPCLCNKGYSKGFGCNTKTGQCECLPGVIGEKCDACPYRWVLIKDQGCTECNICHHALLDVTDHLRSELQPIIDDFQSVALAYFTGQKLNYYDTLADEIEPKVRALDPKGVNLTPSRQEIETLEMDVKNMSKRIIYTEQTAKKCSVGGDKLLKEAADVLDRSRLVSTNSRRTIDEVEKLSRSFDTSASTKVDKSIAEAETILEQLNLHSIDDEQTIKQLDKSNKLLYDTELLIQPVNQQSLGLELLKTGFGTFSDKLEDLHNWSIAANGRSDEVSLFNDRNRDAFTNSKFDTVENQTRETQKNIDDAGNFIINGDLTLNAIDINLKTLGTTLDDLKSSNEEVDKRLPESEEELRLVQTLVINAEKNSNRLANLSNHIVNQYSDITSESQNAIKASTAYSDIGNAVTEAQKAVKNAKYAAGNATELGDGVRERASKSDQAARDLLMNAKNALNTVQNDLDPHLNRSANIVDELLQVNNDSDHKLNAINVALESIPDHSERDVWTEARDKAIDARDDAKRALEILGPIVKQTPKNLESAKLMPKDVDTANKDIIQTKHQVDRVRDLVPQLKNLVDRLDEKQGEISIIGSDLGAQIEKLRNQIDRARQIANSIKVGVTFHPTTVLELKTPDNLPLLATTSRVSAYFNTDKKNGFLMYLGNENKTGSRPGKGNDFLALEIENGYPVLTIDLGNGPEKIVNNKYVADGQWYQVIVERTGNNAKLIIREELMDGTERKYEAQQALPGRYSVFNVDEDSKLYVGGYPPDFVAPKDLTYSSFEGQIEDLKIGDNEVGLWNFVDGQDNNEGAMARDKLSAAETPSTGYRFNGNSYVVLNATSYPFKARSSIHFQFKAPKESKDGLLFYAGKNRHFISVELRDGRLNFQYKLGEHLITMGASIQLNDDNWHRVEAERDGSKGVLKIDGNVMEQQETSVGNEENLRVSEHMYFGGYPGKISHSEVIGTGFNGCIDDVLISGTPVDLSNNEMASGVKTGCPDKFSTTLSYRPREFGYLKKSNVTSDNSFHINLKFRTKQKEGIIFYATNHDQSSTISLAILDGALVMRSMKQDLSTGMNKYNDGEWHVITATHDEIRLRLSVDDSDDYTSVYTPPSLHISHGDIYFGGLPNNFSPVRGALHTLAYFTGCISDVTLNGEIVNFANSTDRLSGLLDDCPTDFLDYNVELVPLYYPGDAHEAIKENQTYVQIPHIYSTDRYPELIPESTSPPETTSAPQESPTPQTRPPTAIVTAPTKKPTRKRPGSESECKLPIDPEFDVGFEAGFRFGTSRYSRVTYSDIPGKIKKSYDISLQFKTESADGLLFYAADARHTDFTALFLEDGKVYHVFRSGPNIVNISSKLEYNDGNWHSVVFSRQQKHGKLIVDNDESNGGLNGNGRDKSTPLYIGVVSPLYIGGVDQTSLEEVQLNLKFEKGTQFHGCIRNIQVFGRLLTHPVTFGVLPCSEQVENGVFIGKGGGYIKLFDKFRVGNEINISFDFKPRSTSGLLFSVHGKMDYLLLELINGTIYFTFDNGDGPVVAVYDPYPEYNFCDGVWRKVQAIKSQYVITLTVNAVSSQPAIGSATNPSTDTTRPLFMGGHPYFKRARGLSVKKSFQGCIRNLKIKNHAQIIRPEMTYGDVLNGVCPIN